MNNENLKNAIAQVIKKNGNNEITATIMQNTLFSIVNQLGNGATYLGIAVPTTTPGTIDANCFYLADTPGIYSNFNAFVVKQKLVLFSNKTGSWVGTELNVPLSNSGGMNDFMTLTPGFSQITGLSVNFDIVKIELIGFYNRNTNGTQNYSQIVTFKVTYMDNTTQNYSYRASPGGVIVSGIETHDIIVGTNKLSFTVRWDGVEINSTTIREIDKRQIQFLPTENNKPFGYNEGKDIQNNYFDKKNVLGSYGNSSTSVINQKKISEFVQGTFDVSVNLLSNDLSNFYMNQRTGSNVLDPLVTNSGNVRVVACKPILLKQNTTYCVNGALLSVIMDGFFSPTEEIKTGSGNGVVFTEFTEITGGYKFTTPSNMNTPYFVMNFYLNTSLTALLSPSQIQEGQTITSYENIGYILKEEALPPINLDVLDLSQLRLDTIPTTNDFTTFNLDYTYDDKIGSLTKFNRIDSAKQCGLVFNENIRAINFKINSLWDSGHIGLIAGIGIENTTNVYAILSIYEGTNINPGVVLNIFASNPQDNSINGGGRVAAPLTAPENDLPKVFVGDILRVELLDNGVFRSTINRNGIIIPHFIFDTKGSWVTPNRLGWNNGLRLGFVSRFASTATNIISDLRIYDNQSDLMLANHRVAKNEQIIFPNLNKPTWLAIGDSITDIDGNNGKGYISFVNRQNWANVINKGYSGWTIYKLWRDRSIGSANKTEWLTSVPNADIITIFAGTNDFDTNFAIPATDEIMDTLPDPHPRFGTFDKNDSDFMNVHTTLGALRTMIEYCLNNNNHAKIVILAPWYREKSKVVSGVIEKMLINSEGRTIYDYADAICKVADEYNLPCINLSRKTGVNTFNLPGFTYDLLHPNEKGSKYLANFIGNIIKDNY